MANKKIYEISINGLTESVKATDALTQKLNSLQQTIKQIKGSKIEIPVDIDSDMSNLTKQLQDMKTKIRQSTRVDTSGDKTYNKLLEERERLLEAVNKELGDTGKNAKEFRQETKDMVAELTKQRNETKEYANTLNGLKAELKDLNAYKGNIDLGSQEYQNVSDRIYILTTRLKELEAAQGIHSRNVGNYTQSITDALDDFRAFGDAELVAEENLNKFIDTFDRFNGDIGVDNFKNLGVSIDDIKKKISELENIIKTADIGSEEWKKANADIVKYKEALGKLESGMKSLNGSTEDFGRKIKVSVNGVDREFNGINRAVQSLSKELQSMYVNGKKDTQEFRNLANVIKNLRKETHFAAGELEEYTKYETKIEKMVGVFQGVGAAMQVSTGIQGLFGGDNDFSQGMQKLMSLMSIMQGLQTLERQFKTGEGLGGYFKKFGDEVKTSSNIAVGSTQMMAKGISTAMTEINSSVTGMTQAFTNVISKSDAFRRAIEDVNNGTAQLRSEWARIIAQAQQLGIAFDTDGDKVEQLQVKINELYREFGKNVAAEFVNSKGITEGIYSIDELRTVIKQTGYEGRQLEAIFEELKDKLDTLRDGVDNEILDGSGIEKNIQAVDELNAKLQEYLALQQKIEQTKAKAIEIGKAQGLSDDDLQPWLDSLEKGKDALDDLDDASNTAGKSAKKLGSDVGKTAKDFKVLGMNISALGRTIKGLLSSIGIGLILVALAPIIEKVSEIIEKFVQWMGVLGNLTNALDSVTSHIDAVNDRLNKLNEAVDDRWDLTEYDKIQQKLKNISKEASNAGQEFKELNQSLALENKSAWYEFWKNDTPIQKQIGNIKEFRKEYDLLKKAVESGLDISQAGGDVDFFGINIGHNNWFADFWSTAGDARDEYGEKQKQLIGDLQSDINSIDWRNLDMTKPMAEQPAKVRQLFKKMDDEMYKSAISNVENLFPNEDWAKVLGARLNQVQDFFNQMDNMARESANARREIEQQIIDNNIEAIGDETKRTIAELNERKKRELEAAGGDSELAGRLRLSIEKKYQRLLNDARNKGNKSATKSAMSLEDVLRKIRDNNLAGEKESLKKRIQALKNSMSDEIAEAKKNGIRVGELIASIQKKYNYLINKEQEAYYDNLNKLTEDYVRKEIKLRQDLQRIINENNQQVIELDYVEKQDTSKGDFDFDAKYGDRLNEERRYNEQSLQMTLEYQRKKNEAEKQVEVTNFDIALQSEKERYEDSLRQLENYKKQGNLTESEYNNLVQKETNVHNKTIENITTEHHNKLLQMERQFANERKETISQSLKDNVSLYENYVDEIDNALSQTGQSKTWFGTTNFSKTHSELKNIKGEIGKVMDGIKDEYKELDVALGKGDITFADYKEAKQQLKELENVVQSQGKEVTQSLDNLILECAGQWKDLIDSWVGQISSMLSTMNETQMQLIDNQLAEIEHQLEIQQDAYDKAEAAAEAHKDKMNNIEDELSNSRGARRQFLIDSLAAQQQAYLEELAAQEKAEEEKKKLEAKQDKLEKKRKEQQKKSAIQQAIINTFTAVSGALAVQPWFLGLALSAVALGLGMANVAAIKNTPIYEDGGVIQGKRHSQGGVKVLGGQAEVEGGEFITNRKSTRANLGLLELINSKKGGVTAEDLASYFNGKTPKVKVNRTARQFAEGGVLPTVDTDSLRTLLQPKDVQEQDDRPVVVQVTDIINAENRLRKIQALSGLNND